MAAAEYEGGAATLDERPEDEARQLIVDLREAARDGRELAKRYAELLEQVVDEYCVEFEKRADAVLARLESR
jgi:hypothetical protein